MTRTREPVSRVRAGGRTVTRTTTPAETLAALREIKRTQSYAIVNGVTVDHYSACAIVAVHDALIAANQAKLLSLPIPRMAAVAFRLLNLKP